MWSPRELAELAGTSRRTVRHYDEVGLLPEPERQSNGYGRYGVRHLVRLLRIRRLSSLGLTLPEIAALGDAQPPDTLIRSLDAQLSGRMAELQRAREELAGMLERPGPAELPVGVARRVAQLPPAERALVVVLSRVLDDAALDAYVGVLAPYRDHPSVAAFDALTDEVDRASRVELASGLADHFARFRSQHLPELERVETSMRRGPSRQRTVDEAVSELYNHAQRDVLLRVRALGSRAAVGQHRSPTSSEPERWSAPARRRVPA